MTNVNNASLAEFHWNREHNHRNVLIQREGRLRGSTFDGTIPGFPGHPAAQFVAPNPYAASTEDLEPLWYLIWWSISTTEIQ
jgi:hypothetical protein